MADFEAILQSKDPDEIQTYFVTKYNLPSCHGQYIRKDIDEAVDEHSANKEELLHSVEDQCSQTVCILAAVCAFVLVADTTLRLCSTTFLTRPLGRARSAMCTEGT